MPVDGDALRSALAETARDHGPGIYGLVTEAGKPVFTAPSASPTWTGHARSRPATGTG